MHFMSEPTDFQGTYEDDQKIVRRKKKDTDDLFYVSMEAYEIIEKRVKSSGNTGRIYLPTDWIGQRVKVVRVTPIDRSEEKAKNKK